MIAVKAHVRGQEPGRRKDIIVHEHDHVAARTSDADVAASREPRIVLAHDVQGTRRPEAAYDVFVGAVRRTVIHLHDFIECGIEVLREQRIHDLAEQRPAVVRADLHGDEGRSFFQRRRADFSSPDGYP